MASVTVTIPSDEAEVFVNANILQSEFHGLASRFAPVS